MNRWTWLAAVVVLLGSVDPAAGACTTAQTEAGCATCEVDGCTTCQTGYDPSLGSTGTADDTCVLTPGACVETEDGCESCNANGGCATCLSGYDPSAGETANLDTCELRMGDCVINQAGCTACNRLAGCAICSSTHTLVLGTSADLDACVVKSPCDLADNNCLTCYQSSTGTPTKCSACKTGYEIGTTADKECVLKCPTSCTACTGTPSRIQCTTCNTAGGFVLAPTTAVDVTPRAGACVPEVQCPTTGNIALTCSKCYKSNSKFLCSECKAGYISTPAGLCVPVCTPKDGINRWFDISTDPDSCKNCNAAAADLGEQCKTCQPAALGRVFAGKCLECNEGYYLDSTTLAGRQCVACPLGCATCTPGGSTPVCHTCLKTYFWEVNSDGDGICSSCTATNCHKCESTPQASCDRTGCAPGYWFNTAQTVVTNRCTSCGTNCKLCQGSKCVACEETFTLINVPGSTPVCQSCGGDYKCPSGKCAASGGCSGCNAGSYLASPSIVVSSTTVTVKQCAACTAGCASCSSGSACTTCLNGFYKAATNTCTPCRLTNCASCSSVSTCSVCNMGYWLKADGTCAACSSSPTSCGYCKGISNPLVSTDCVAAST